MRAGPRRGMTQETRALAISTLSAVSRTTTGSAGMAGDAPGTSVRLAVRPASAGREWALHLSEPSGQVASGQDWRGIDTPAESWIAKAEPAGTPPRGQGTPSVAPGCSAGMPSSQWRTARPDSAELGGVPEAGAGEPAVLGEDSAKASEPRGSAAAARDPFLTKERRVRGMGSRARALGGDQEELLKASGESGHPRERRRNAAGVTLAFAPLSGARTREPCSLRRGRKPR